ncbi:hypothetical protein [Halobaculum limi]|uniref:hypothetical protein n=1 Tax=Halobaculum limi TaxID=3031916 RepID=UPI002407252F|nr:hypothetical protein [Halobaculum sp. YSMS11]
MITNREIASERLLGEALDEVIESARENGFDDATLAAALHERAATLEQGAVNEDTGVSETE